MKKELVWCYRELGIPYGTDINEVKKAFRRLALQYHPDRRPYDREASVKFSRIVRAYHTLNKVLGKKERKEKNWFFVSRSIDELFKEFISMKESVRRYNDFKFSDELLLERLKSDNVHLRRQVVKILLERGNRDTIRKLKDYLKNEKDVVIAGYLRSYMGRERLYAR